MLGSLFVFVLFHWFCLFVLNIFISFYFFL